MPSEPRLLRGTVRVRHPKFGEKTVTRAQLRQLSPNWARVVEKPKRAKKRTQSPPSEAVASASAPAADPAPEPDVPKE